MSNQMVEYILTDAFGDLRPREFKKFRLKLLEKSPNPRDAVEMDAMDLARLLLHTCTEAGAVQLTLDIFTQLGLHSEAKKLRDGKTVTVTKTLTTVFSFPKPDGSLT